MRAAFENRANGASIECYADDPGSLGSLIDATMREGGLTIAAEARAGLQALLGADRQTTRSEMAKLMLYALGRSRIEAADVEAIVSDAAPSVLDELIDRALLGDLPAAAACATRFFRDGGDAQGLMARLAARLTLVNRLRLEMDQGRSFEAACQALFVRLPPRALGPLGAVAGRWTANSIARQFPAVRAAAARVRAEPHLSEALATRALWALASRSGRPTRLSNTGADCVRADAANRSRDSLSAATRSTTVNDRVYTGRHRYGNEIIELNPRRIMSSGIGRAGGIHRRAARNYQMRCGCRRSRPSAGW